ncbi:MAG: quinol dehydrogenase ferredoxin subunit NapH [Campylobacteraceae bacterium]|nr:quinol dehydrogenase ferredoxin subunit NapH [Campylobacteraceae bacterium]
MKKYRFLILRRFIQISILVLFFLGNYIGLKILQGNLSAGLFLDTLNLSDPYAVLQLLFAGGNLDAKAIVGALIILLVYALIFGRVFCSYVCPINIVTDSAGFLSRKLEINKLKYNLSISRNVRYWVMVLALILSFVFGVAAFESISPVSILHREIIFGVGIGLLIIVAIFIFDLFVLKDGFCGHLCPLGAFYAFTSHFALLKVKYNNKKCTKCMECKVVCPEKQVLNITNNEYDSFVQSGECTKCGRCIEVCEDNALSFSINNFAQSQKDTKNEKDDI